MQSKENPYFNPSSICTPWKRLDWIGPWTQNSLQSDQIEWPRRGAWKASNEAAVGDLAWRKLNVSTEYLRYLVTALLLQAKWVHTIHFSKMKRSSVVHKKGQQYFLISAFFAYLSHAKRFSSSNQWSMGLATWCSVTALLLQDQDSLLWSMGQERPTITLLPQTKSALGSRRRTMIRNTHRQVLPLNG